MALWTGLGQAATVAQLVGADVGGLIYMIMQAALTARQNRKECEQLARRVLMIAQLLPHVQDPEAAQQLAGLGDTLRDAHELVVSCQGRTAVYQLVMAGRQAERFREVQSKIDFYLILFPVISHIGITRRLERIYNVLVQQDDSTGAGPSQLAQSSTQLQAVTQELVPHRTQEFTLAEIMAGTNNFSPDTRIGEGAFGTVYHCRLHDGREVAVKRRNRSSFNSEQYIERLSSPLLLEEFHTEIDVLSRLRHKHIVRLLGSCVTVSEDKRLQANTLKKMLTRRSKEPEEEPERLILYEYMENGSLDNQLHGNQSSSSLPPVTLSWKMRIDVLLGVSRAVEHLHCHANPPIIHRDIKASNILLDASWVPRLSDFGLAMTRDMARELSGSCDLKIIGTDGYMAPEYIMSGYLSLASDVHSLGVLMLEVLTGKTLLELLTGEIAYTFGSSPIVPGFLDRRPVPEPTPWQLQALKRVAWTARCCVKLDPGDRLAISDVVANLEMAHELIYRGEAGSFDDSASFDEVPDSPRASSVSSRDEAGSFDDSASLVEVLDSPRASSVSSQSYYSGVESEGFEECVDSQLDTVRVPPGGVPDATMSVGVGDLDDPRPARPKKPNTRYFGPIWKGI